MFFGPGGETGIHKRLKISRRQLCAGSIPALGTEDISDLRFVI